MQTSVAYDPSSETHSSLLSSPLLSLPHLHFSSLVLKGLPSSSAIPLAQTGLIFIVLAAVVLRLVLFAEFLRLWFAASATLCVHAFLEVLFGPCISTLLALSIGMYLKMRSRILEFVMSIELGLAIYSRTFFRLSETSYVVQAVAYLLVSSFKLGLEWAVVIPCWCYAILQLVDLLPVVESK